MIIIWCSKQSHHIVVNSISLIIHKHPITLILWLIAFLTIHLKLYDSSVLQEPIQIFWSASKLAGARAFHRINLIFPLTIKWTYLLMDIDDNIGLIQGTCAPNIERLQIYSMCWLILRWRLDRVFNRYMSRPHFVAGHKSNLPLWPHGWCREQGWRQSGGSVPHGTGGYRTSTPQWQYSSSKPTAKTPHIAYNQLPSYINNWHIKTGIWQII